ncbi:MAG: type II toxin-antitoxin system HicA family toxin [Acidimicrobiaceae bacterium]|nr:type II toxin-antitoxin system HicA family toxin [Acidimicrobiaceae bacterium]MDE0499164.1 type II toxin-antitoxin system HicA family toxin [Acidimicrobiaceae bacterium]
MNQRLGPVSRRDLIKALRRSGWSGPWHGSKHQMMHKGKRKLRLPNPHGPDISSQLLSVILEQAGISRAEWHRVNR